MIKNPVKFIFDGLNVYLREEQNRAPRHYLRIKNKQIWFHHYLANKYIRQVKFGEIVHHKDENPLNDTISNLRVVSRADHARIHKPALGYKFTEEQQEQLRISHLGQPAWNKGMRGLKRTLESKKNMSKAQQGRTITWGQKITEAKTGIFKVYKNEVLEFLTRNPNSTCQKILDYFNFKSYSPIRRMGGMEKLKNEAKQKALYIS